MPSGVVADANYLYVADARNNKIRKVLISTGTVSSLAGSGRKGADDGTGVFASFDFPKVLLLMGATFMYQISAITKSARLRLRLVK